MSPVHARCPKCQHTLHVGEGPQNSVGIFDTEGQSVKCPACSTIFPLSGHTITGIAVPKTAPGQGASQ